MKFFNQFNTKKISENENNTAEEKIFSTTFEVSNHISVVSESQAMMIPIFKNGIEMISNSIAQLPLQLFAKRIGNNIEIIQNDSRLKILNKRSNPQTTAFSLKKDLVKDLILYGHAYIYRKNQHFFILPADQMSIQKYTTDKVTVERVEYILNNSNGKHIFNETEVIHFESGTNGVLYDGSETLESAINQQTYSKNIFKNGALPVGILKANTRLTEKAIKSLRESWENLYTGAQKSGKTLVLEDGLDYKPLSLDPERMGLDNSASRVNSEIAKLLNIPLSMLDESANKYNSVATKNLLFLQTTISPILKILEETFNFALLTSTEELQGFEFRFNTQEFLRGTNDEQSSLAIKLFTNGVISYHELRSMLELPYDDSQDYTKDSIGSVYRYADGTTLNLNTQTKTKEVI